MKNKIYFPKDDDMNIFSAVQSKDGLVIPLSYWGYPNIHVTIFSREIKRRPGWNKFSVHLKRNGDSSNFYEFYQEFDKNKFNQKNKRLEEEIKKIFTDFLRKYSGDLPENSICLDCAIKEMFKGANKKIKNKEDAQKFYRDLIKRSKNLDEFENKFKRCNKPGHYLFYNNKKKTLYVKYPSGYVSYLDNKKLEKNLVNLLKQNFTNIFNNFKNIIKDAKKALRRYLKR